MSNFFGVGGATIILAILAWIITQNIYVGLSILVLSWALNITMLLAIVPILGLIAQYFALNYLMDMMVSILVIPASVMWIANICWWLALSCGFFVTLWVIGGILSYSKK